MFLFIVDIGIIITECCIICYISEGLLCTMSSTGGTDFVMTLRIRDSQLFTEVVFLDYDAWITNDNIVPINDSLCIGEIIDGKAMFYFDAATAPTCDITINPGGVNNCLEPVHELYFFYIYRLTHIHVDTCQLF